MRTRQVRRWPSPPLAGESGRGGGHKLRRKRREDHPPPPPPVKGGGAEAAEYGKMHHSPLMLAVRMTLAHFWVSATKRLPNSAGLPLSASQPRSAMRCLIVGSSRPALIVALSRLMISGGVCFGAPMP